MVGNNQIRHLSRKRLSGTRSIGSGLRSTGNRTYRTENGKSVLVAWADKRCVICNRLLKKFQHKFCSLHGVGSKEYTAYNLEKIHQYNRDYRDTHHFQELARHAENNGKRKEQKLRECFRVFLSLAVNAGSRV